MSDLLSSFYVVALFFLCSSHIVKEKVNNTQMFKVTMLHLIFKNACFENSVSTVKILFFLIFLKIKVHE